MTWENVVRAYSLGAAVAPVLQCGGGSRRTRTDFAKVFRKVLSEHREWIVANGGFDHFLPSHLLVSQSTATRERQHLDLIDDADLTLDSLLQLQDSHQGDPAASGSPDEDLTLDRMVELNEEIEPGQEDSAATPDTSSTTTPESHDVIAMQSNLDDDGNSSLSNDDTVAFACKQCGSLTYASSQSVDCRTESTQQEDMDTDIANKDHTRTSADKNTDFVKKESVFANTNPDFLDTDPDYSNKDPDYTKTPDFADKGPDLANQDSDLPDVVLTMNDTCGLITGDPVAAKGEAVPGDDCDHLPVTTILLTTAVICFGGYAAYKAYQYFTWDDSFDAKFP